MSQHPSIKMADISEKCQEKQCKAASIKFPKYERKSMQKFVFHIILFTNSSRCSKTRKAHQRNKTHKRAIENREAWKLCQIQTKTFEFCVFRNLNSPWLSPSRSTDRSISFQSRPARLEKSVQKNLQQPRQYKESRNVIFIYLLHNIPSIRLHGKNSAPECNGSHRCHTFRLLIDFLCTRWR